MKIGEGFGDKLLGPLLSSPDRKFLVYNYEEYTPATVIKIAWSFEVVNSRRNGFLALLKNFDPNHARCERRERVCLRPRRAVVPGFV